MDKRTEEEEDYSISYSSRFVIVASRAEEMEEGWERYLNMPIYHSLKSKDVALGSLSRI